VNVADESSATIVFNVIGARANRVFAVREHFRDVLQ
jgi:hypothetical protein